VADALAVRQHHRPKAAVISSALVISKTHTYSPKMSPAMAETLPEALAASRVGLPVMVM
jgi:hypothetical protein